MCFISAGVMACKMIFSGQKQKKNITTITETNHIKSKNTFWMKCTKFKPRLCAIILIASEPARQAISQAVSQLAS